MSEGGKSAVDVYGEQGQHDAEPVEPRAEEPATTDLADVRAARLGSHLSIW